MPAANPTLTPSGLLSNSVRSIFGMNNAPRVDNSTTSATTRSSKLLGESRDAMVSLLTNSKLQTRLLQEQLQVLKQVRKVAGGPGITELTLSKLLGRALGGVGGGIFRGGAGLTRLAGTGLRGITRALLSSVSRMVPATLAGLGLPKLFSGLGGISGGMGSKALSFLGKGLGGVGGIARVLGRIGSKFFLPLTAIFSAFDAFQGFTNADKLLGRNGVGIVGRIGAAVSGVVNGLLLGIPDWISEKLGFNNFASLVDTSGQMIGELAGKATGLVLKYGLSISTFVGEALANPSKFLPSSDTLKAVYDDLNTSVTGLLLGIADYTGKALDTAAGWISKGVTIAQQGASAAAQFVYDQFTQPATPAITPNGWSRNPTNSAKGTVTSTVIGGVSRPTQPRSLAGIPQNTMSPVMAAVSAATPVVTSAITSVQDVTKAAIDAIGDTSSKVVDSAKEVADATLTAAKKAYDALTSGLQTTMDDLFQAKIGDSIKNLGKFVAANAQYWGGIVGDMNASFGDAVSLGATGYTTTNSFNPSFAGGTSTGGIVGTGGSLGTIIGSGEGDYGSYNMGNAGDAKGKKIDFSSMSIADVMARQSLPPGHPDRLFAVGKYQVIPSTMRGAVQSLGLDTSQKFTPDVQERIFREYLISSKRPQVKAFITGNGDIKAAAFALAQEFASVADPNTGKSYYGGVGNNAASISTQQVYAGLLAERAKYQSFIQQGMSPEDAWIALSGKPTTNNATQTPPVNAGTPSSTDILGLGNNNSSSAPIPLTSGVDSSVPALSTTPTPAPSVGPVAKPPNSTVKDVPKQKFDVAPTNVPTTTTPTGAVPVQGSVIAQNPTGTPSNPMPNAPGIRDIPVIDEFVLLMPNSTAMR